MLGKGELAWDTWPNHLVGRPSLQSGNETNDLLKSRTGNAASGVRLCMKTQAVCSQPIEIRRRPDLIAASQSML